MPLIQNFLNEKIKLWNVIKSPSVSLELLSKKTGELSDIYWNLSQQYFREGTNKDSFETN